MVITVVPVHAAPTAPAPMPAAAQQATLHAVPQFEASTSASVASPVATPSSSVATVIGLGGASMRSSA
jgi:hypothetical protein